jgi:hypothetical protein
MITQMKIVAMTMKNLRRSSPAFLRSAKEEAMRLR